MAKSKVDSGDLRSRKRSNTKDSLRARKQRIELVAQGICVMCKKAWVNGRKTCIKCSTGQSVKTALWGFRKILRQHGIDNPNEALETLALAKGEENAAVINAIMEAIEASEYKNL